MHYTLAAAIRFVRTNRNNQAGDPLPLVAPFLSFTRRPVRRTPGAPSSSTDLPDTFTRFHSWTGKEVCRPGSRHEADDNATRADVFRPDMQNIRGSAESPSPLAGLAATSAIGKVMDRQVQRIPGGCSPARSADLARKHAWWRPDCRTASSSGVLCRLEAQESPAPDQTTSLQFYRSLVQDGTRRFNPAGKAHPVKQRFEFHVVNAATGSGR